MAKSEVKLVTSMPFYVVSQGSFEGNEATLGALRSVAQ